MLLFNAVVVACVIYLPANFAVGDLREGSNQLAIEGNPPFTWVFQVGWDVSFYLENPLSGQIILPSCGGDDGVECGGTPGSPGRAVWELEEFHLVSLLHTRSVARPTSVLVCAVVDLTDRVWCWRRRRRCRRQWGPSGGGGP